MDSTVLNSMSLQLSSSSLRARRSNLKCSERLLRFARNDGMRVWMRGLICMLVVVFSFSASSIYAAESEKKEDPFRLKKLEGEITGKTRSNVSIQYGQEGDALLEALIPVDEKMSFKGYKSYRDIKSGDIVSVEFKEYYRMDDNGKEIITGKKATRIQYLRPGRLGRLMAT